MEDIIIWGGGKAALKRYEWAVFTGYNVLFFVDNNPDLWGKRINGISICSPEVIKEYKCTILTSDMYFREIREQLDNMAYKGNVVGISLFKKESLCKEGILADFPQTNISDKMSFIFDAYFPEMNWGGTEEWSCMVANSITNLGVQTWMICGMNNKFDEFAHNCMHFDTMDEINMIKEMAQKIAEKLPCIFISHASIALYAARMVKTLFPDKIKLIVVAHGSDPDIYYRELMFWSDRIDNVVCISKKIQSELQELLGSKKDILIYRPNPILIPTVLYKREIKNEALRIGFAARLKKKQKRVHLLPQIINACTIKKLNVKFEIAGEGDCLELLKKYVSDKQLEDQVHILGWISPKKMADFWRRQDIYLNISDFEGMSLAMLEAMVCGVVPVITDVSGVSDVIEDGKNGFVVPVDNWMETVDKIEMLDNNRELLYKASLYNMQLVREKCNITDYAVWMIDTFDIKE
jgi:Glycosyltransferase